MPLIQLLLTLVVILIIAGLLWWAVTRLAAAFGIPGPIVAVIEVVLVILLVIVLLQAFGFISGGPLTLR